MPERNGGPSSIPAWGVALVALGLYLAFPQHSHWGDGRRLIALAGLGEWRYYHVLYLPAAQLFRFVLRPFLGDDPERAMMVLAAVSCAGGAGLQTRAAGWLGAPPLAAILGGLLTAVTPTVLFFATSVEVHAPQVLTAGAVLWGFARWRRSGEVPNALVLSLLFLGLVGTHLTGALWAPAFLYLALFGTGRLRLPEHAFAGALALAGGYFVWKVANPGESQGWKVAGSAFAALQRAPNLEYLMKELVLNGAFLFVLPPLLLIRRRLDRTGLVLVLLVFAPQVILFQTLGIEEQGAYFITLFPLLGLLSSLALPRLGRAALPVAAVLLAGQAVLAHEFVWQWQNGYRGAEWAEPLIREAGDRGLLLALENWEAHAVQRHSHLDAVSLRIKENRRVVELPLENPAQQASALFLIEQSRAEGGLVAVTRSLLDYGRENETVRRFLERLVERFGELKPGDHPAYFVFPRS